MSLRGGPDTAMKATDSPADEIRNPLFARLFPLCARLMERDAAAHRHDLLHGLRGRVVEIGAGNGMNFPHYGTGVEEVSAIEPEPYLRAKAVAAAAEASVAVSVVAAVADRLPFEDASFDAGVCSLVLCSVADPAAALAELRRVLRPASELRFFEHVRGPTARKARVQHAFDRSGVWPRVAGGCHCARDTGAVITAAGFAITSLREVGVGPSWGLTHLHVLGAARTP
jgi:SAM-dependent methyltransferase